MGRRLHLPSRIISVSKPSKQKSTNLALYTFVKSIEATSYILTTSTQLAASDYTEHSASFSEDDSLLEEDFSAGSSNESSSLEDALESKFLLTSHAFLARLSA